ncbi:hypothetical protein N7461_005089 [Penicillium sp. DV-2018c]|nr:hypothetical protein N7461_005089 [Penicillium sp. DV-2018c]
MPVYAITGVSKRTGIFNTVETVLVWVTQTDLVPGTRKTYFVGLVRDRAGTEKMIAAELSAGSRPNIHIRHADLTDYASLKRAAADSLTRPRSSDEPKEIEAVSARLMQANVVVEVGHYVHATPEELQAFAGFGEKPAKYAPHFKGPIKPEGSVRHLRSTWGKASVEGGFGGAFISHLGNKQWM